MQKTHIAFEPIQLATIKDYAVDERISVNQAVRSLVDIALKKLHRKKTASETILEWAQKDPFSGSPDLASNDDYLYKL